MALLPLNPTFAWMRVMQLFSFRWLSVRMLIWIALATVLVVWGLTDVRNRGRWDPATPLNHMTDLTVYTEAGAAFFDGRDPYTVSNHRGWHYLYPPLLAIVLAPLARLDSQWQVVIWYFINLAITWGCCYESWRLLRIFFSTTPHPRPLSRKGRGENVGEASFHKGSVEELTYDVDRAVPLSPGGRGVRGEGEIVNGFSNPTALRTPPWLIAAAAGAMLLPTLNTLQRGQVGLLVAYLVLLGFRLAIGAKNWRGYAAGGMAMALAVTVKLTPIMPALFLAAMLLLPVVAGWNRKMLGPASGFLGGMAIGAVLFLLLLPAAAVGWSANLHHLHRFVDLIVLNHDMGGENDLTYHSVRNQSLINSAYRLGNWIAYAAGKGPDDLADPDVQGGMPMDQPIVHQALTIVRLGLLALLAAVGWMAARRGTVLDLAAAFGAACVATLLVSPLSWAHHYPIEAPGLLAIPFWFWQRGRIGTAKSLAVSACGLMWAHYLLLDWTGRAGLLGLGTTVWFIVAAIGMLRGGDDDAAALSRTKLDGQTPELRAA